MIFHSYGTVYQRVTLLADVSLLDHPQISQICWQTTWNHQSGLYIATSMHSKPPTDQWPIKITTEPWVCLDFGGQEEINKSFNFLSTALIDLNDRLDHFVHFSMFLQAPSKMDNRQFELPPSSRTVFNRLQQSFTKLLLLRPCEGAFWAPQHTATSSYLRRPRNAINQEDTY